MSKFIIVAHIDELAPGSSKAIKAENLLIALFRVGSGEYYAIENSCPHAGVPLDNGNLDGKEVACVWHDWVFSLETGDSPTNPGACVKTFPVKVEGSDIMIEIQE